MVLLGKPTILGNPHIALKNNFLFVVHLADLQFIIIELSY